MAKTLTKAQRADARAFDKGVREGQRLYHEDRRQRTLGRLHDGSDTDPEERPAEVVRVCDLPEAPPPGVSLYCPECGETYSASRGDYFLLDPGEPFTCGVRDVEDGERCGEPLQLVRKVTQYLPWRDR